MQDILFYSFAILSVLSALAVISVSNPVHSVLFLIFVFFNGAGIFLLLGAEYISMTLVIVYVGAVAILFLFVVMMLNINIADQRASFFKYFPLGLILGGLVFVHLYLAIDLSRQYLPERQIIDSAVTNTKAIGMLLYTDYFFAFQGVGIMLLVAMIGAILLTLTHSTTVRRQDICKQVKRRRFESVSLVSVKSGQGVRDL